METGCERGTWADVNSIMSVTIRTAGPGGEIHSFWAMNSFSMSFWIVPPSRSQGTPCFSATARYMARRTEAVQLTVMEVVTSPSGIPAKRRSMSSRVEIETPSRPTSPRPRAPTAPAPRESPSSRRRAARPLALVELQQVTRDHELLDLGGALVDL